MQCWIEIAKERDVFPCCVLNIVEKARSLSPLGKVLLPGIFLSMLFIRTRKFFSLLPESERMLSFVTCFSASIYMIIRFLAFGLLTSWIPLINVRVLHLLCIPSTNHRWLWCSIFKNISLDPVGQYYAEHFVSVWVTLVCSFLAFFFFWSGFDTKVMLALQK